MKSTLEDLVPPNMIDLVMTATASSEVVLPIRHTSSKRALVMQMDLVNYTALAASVPSGMESAREREGARERGRECEIDISQVLLHVLYVCMYARMNVYYYYYVCVIMCVCVCVCIIYVLHYSFIIYNRKF
jgi:hypothetical protein